MYFDWFNPCTKFQKDTSEIKKSICLYLLSWWCSNCVCIWHGYYNSTSFFWQISVSKLFYRSNHTQYSQNCPKNLAGGLMGALDPINMKVTIFVICSLFVLYFTMKMRHMRIFRGFSYPQRDISATNHHCWTDTALKGQHPNQYTTKHCLTHSVSVSL